MNINNARNEIRKYTDPVKSSVHKLAISVVVIAVLLALVMYFTGRAFFTGIVHWVELVQAVLVCSTALMGLSGLMIIEARKTNAIGLFSKDMLEKIQAINTITSLAKAEVVLQWSVLFSIFSIIGSGLCIMMASLVFLIVSLVAFIAQIYLFMFGLIFSDFLPS